MTKKRILISLLSVFFLPLFLASCDQDPFHQNSRKIAGVYYLQRWEDGKTYYIDKKNGDGNGGGAIGGIALKIGWNANYILALRKATYQGDVDGWMLIDTKKQSVIGPLSEAAIANNPELKSIEVYSPQDAWKKLN